MAREKVYPFLYTLKDASGEVCKHGKGTVPTRSKKAILSYLKKRHYTWDSAKVKFHGSEDAALDAERAADDRYIAVHGKLPRGSKKRGGGGRRAVARCKAKCLDGTRCRYKPLEGNYGYCGVHR